MEIFSNAAPLLTTTRESFIEVFRTLAEGIDESFLLSTKKPPIVGVIGGFDCGKSLAIEVMMKTLARQDIADTLDNEQQHMFLEEDPSDALGGVSGIFNLAGGNTIRQVFISGALDYRNLRNPEKIILNDFESYRPKIEGGAIFLAGKSPPKREEDYWISIGIKKHFPTYLSHSQWRRGITISVNNPELWAHPSFTKAREALGASHRTSSHSHCGLN